MKSVCVREEGGTSNLHLRCDEDYYLPNQPFPLPAIRLVIKTNEDFHSLCLSFRLCDNDSVPLVDCMVYPDDNEDNTTTTLEVDATVSASKDRLLLLRRNNQFNH